MPCPGITCTFALFVVFCTVASCQTVDFSAEASRLQPWLVETRRALHEKPELMYEEVETSKYIQGALDDMKISYR